MSDLFASGNSMGGSGPGGAGSSGRGAGGVGEYGKGAGGVGEYGSGAGGAGTFGSGAGGSGVGVNYETVTRNKDNNPNKLLWGDTEPSYFENEISDGNAKARLFRNQSKYLGAVPSKGTYEIKSPFTYYMLRLLYPVIYIPLVLMFINACIVLIASFITNNPLGISLIWVISELLGMCVVAYIHQYLIRKIKVKVPV